MEAARQRMSRTPRGLRFAFGLVLGLGALGVFSASCSAPEVLPRAPAAPLREVAHTPQDATPKQDRRLVPAEAYVRTYLQLFGGLAPLEVQRRARGGDGGALFDTWDDYLSALGFPDYRLDLPRGTQTNALMIAAFERLGVALCDRSLEHDLKAKPPLLVKDRLVFAFEPPASPVSEPAFERGFDVLHRTFLGYPSRLAPAGRAESFYALYQEIVAHHAEKGAPKSRFTPSEAGWAAVCYGLVRHPEFHLY
jgi:hypothetical protein